METKVNLVVRPEKLGDLIVATPVFRAFKESYPDQPLHLLTDEVFAEAVRHDPHLDKIITVRWKGRERGKRESWKSIYNKLRGTKYERAALLYYNVEGFNLLMKLLGVRHVAQLGGTYNAYLFGHQMVLRKMFQERAHYADWYLKVAEKLGAVTQNKNPEVFITKEETSAFENRFPDVLLKKTRILVHPFGHGSSPNYSQEAYARLIERLQLDFESEIYLSGNEAEGEAWRSKFSTGARLDWLGHLSLREWMVAATKVDVVICGSTGVVHVAAALGVPTVGLYCPFLGSHPDIWGPKGLQVSTLIAPPERCGKIGGSPAACCGTNACDLIGNISLDEVCRVVGKILRNRKN